jgi:ketosteroid isomerase-like protein
MTTQRSAAALALLLAGAFGAPTPAGAAGGRDQAIKDLVQVEREFAATAGAKNWRDAFAAYFADDGVWFTPNPTLTKPALAGVPPDALKDKVEWFATRTEASHAGDLGFNTGPYRWTNPDPKRPVRHGYFFTIWKRKADGGFKVALDFGARSTDPTPETEHDWRALSGSAYVSRPGDPTPTADDLGKKDQALTAAIREHGLAAGYAQLLDAEGALLREEKRPLRTPAAIREYLAAQKNVREIEFEPLHTELASSGDLGYTYGSYTAIARDFGPDIISYYVHVWRRDAKGDWKLVFDVANAPNKAPVPAATPRPRPKR